MARWQSSAIVARGTRTPWNSICVNATMSTTITHITIRVWLHGISTIIVNYKKWWPRTWPTICWISFMCHALRRCRGRCRTASSSLIAALIWWIMEARWSNTLWPPLWRPPIKNCAMWMDSKRNWIGNCYAVRYVSCEQHCRRRKKCRARRWATNGHCWALRRWRVQECRRDWKLDCIHVHNWDVRCFFL